MGNIPVHPATLTFHVDPDLKARLERAAASQSRPVEEVLRELVKDFVEQQHRHQFLAEARRQSREAAAVAANPDSDEAAVLRELAGGWNERETG